MGRNPRTTIVDVAFRNTEVTDPQALRALSEIHVSATRAACQSLPHLLDFEEYAAVGREI